MNLLNRSYALHDRKMGGNLDVNHDLHTNETGDRIDLNLDVTKVGNRDHRMNGMDDQNDLMMVVNLLNRNCALHDQNLVANSDAKNLHVMLMVYLNKSCDRMSHDHLQCDHQMMRRHDTNRMDVMILDGMNPDVKMMNSGAMNSDARMI